jgi:hypothetical protein
MLISVFNTFQLKEFYRVEQDLRLLQRGERSQQSRHALSPQREKAEHHRYIQTFLVQSIQFLLFT